MKTYTYLTTIFLLLLLGTSTFSQEITINPREKSVAGYSTSSNLASAVITNNANDPADSLFMWTIIEYAIPNGWEFSFCDNFNCYYNLQLNSSQSFKLRKGESGPLKGDFIYNAIGGNAFAKVVVNCKTNQNIVDTFTMTAKGWATGLNDIKKTADVSFYPNPAKDVITIKQNSNKQTEVAIYNVLGSKVKTITVGAGENALNISDLQKGMYFIRYTENGALVSKTFTKAE